MGRAKGDPARSKSRPSSSSLAAAHLQVPGAAPLGFGGYVGSSLVDTTLSVEREVSPDLDGEAAVHLKRLSKRDTTTKLKALAALRGIFKEHSVDKLATILMTWVFEYKRLVQDNNRQVRESAHNAMADLTTNAGRGLAPHLRSLMGAWWVAQFDPSREVAEAAQHSFQVTFPERKRRVDVLIYCLKDIVSHLDENLKLTPQILTESGTPSEEVAEKLERILSSSLLALAALLDVLVGSTSSLWREGPAEGIPSTSTAVEAGEAVKEAATSLFLKHKSLQSSVKNKSSQVRSAAYQALRTYIQHIPQVFTDQENLDDSVKLVLGSLGEKTPSCHQPMWDMVLLFSKGFPQAWGCGCIRKAVLPKIWDFLRNGCYGSQQISYPYIFPLIALIPPQFLAPPQGFFREFFGSLWQGGNVTSLGTTDRLALLKTFHECFVWVVRNAKRYVGEEQVKDLQVFLVEEVLLKIVWYYYLRIEGQNGDSITGGAIRPDVPTDLSQEALDKVAVAVVDIMIVLGQDEGVLDAFWPGFHTVCLNILLETSPENKLRLAHLVEFFSLLDVKITRQDKTKIKWPLRDVVQPFVAKAFPAIRSSGPSEAIKLLGQLTSSYGTSAFASTEQAVSEGVEQLFQKEVVPWCLTAADDQLTSSKIELLLAFFEVKELQCYWESTVEHATAWQRSGEEVCNEELVQVGVLATLVEKFSERWVRLVEPEEDVLKKAAVIQAWRSPRIDAAGLAVACSSSLPQPPCLRLLRNLLGAKTPEIKLSPLLSPDAAVSVLEKLLQHLLVVLSLHDTPWTRAAPSYILSGEVDNGLSAQIDDTKRAKCFELARSALEVVGASLLSVAHLENESIGSQLLSAIFCLYWAFLKPAPSRTAKGDHYESEDEVRDEEVHETIAINLDGDGNSFAHEPPSSETQLEQSRLLANCLQALRKSSSPGIFQGLSAPSRGRVRRILIEFVRSALSHVEFSDAVSTSSLCASWVWEVVRYFCEEEDEIQETISLVLAPSKSWPLRASASQSKDDSSPSLKLPRKTTLADEELHKQFCAFADTLAAYLGPERVFVGCASMSSDTDSSSYRVWLVIELLCTQTWPGGCASNNLVEFLCEFADSARGQKLPAFLEMCLRSLFVGSSSISSDQIMGVGAGGDDDSTLESNPFTEALLILLRALLDEGEVWGRADAERFFFEYVAKVGTGDDSAELCSVTVLPSVLSILMPVLRQQTAETSATEGVQIEGFQSLKQDVCEWLNRALSCPPLVEASTESDGKQWLQVAIACFPLQLPGVTAGIAAASAAKVSLQETSLLLKLLKRQSLLAQEAEPQLLSAGKKADGELIIELTLAQLIAVSVAYCWQEFGVEEWAFVLGRLRKWLDSAVVEFEEMTEVVVGFFKEGQQGVLGLQQLSGRKILIELAATAVSILILVKDLNKLESVKALRALATLRVSNWEAMEDHMTEDILRILLATGLSESAAMDANVGSYAANLISKHRMVESVLWEGLSVNALAAMARSREAAVRAADLWGIGKGSISALYALLFSRNSSGALQWVAFEFLSTEPLLQLAVTGGGALATLGEVEEGAPQEDVTEGDSLAAVAKLRPELAKVLETPAVLLLQSSFTSSLRVNYLLGWSLFLTRLQALPPLSPTRERLLQFAQDSNTPFALLDCLYQHIPLDLTSGTSASRRRAAAVGAKISVAATSATEAVLSGSVSWAVERLWPVREENMVVLAGAIYGLLLRVLPACVRIWFTGLRDRSTASAIENFTSSHCSLHLLADEFSQLQASVVADDTLSIRANRTLREVTALYKKEEAGLDIVIRLPSCYPLRAVEVDCTRRLGISETLLRKWILSMASFLRNQNGALLEAIQMWKKNVDREFEGVEECPICYSIIHTTNHSLPRLACKTCKHKFHSACLYKWFSTSHKSTCPLCQTPF